MFYGFELGTHTLAAAGAYTEVATGYFFCWGYSSHAMEINGRTLTRLGSRKTTSMPTQNSVSEMGNKNENVSS